MIIFYNKKTRDIFGVIGGRVHDKNTIENGWLQPGHLKKEDVGKYIVPFKQEYETVEEPQYELRVVDKNTMKVDKVRIGFKQVKKPTGMKPDVPFSKLINKFESRQKDIYSYKVILDDSFNVIGFELK